MGTARSRHTRPVGGTTDHGPRELLRTMLENYRDLSCAATIATTRRDECKEELLMTLNENAHVLGGSDMIRCGAAVFVLEMDADDYIVDITMSDTKIAVL